MKQESKHRAQQNEELAKSMSPQNQNREFATTEELFQHDAAQTDVPPVIAERLTNSIKDLPRPNRPWWQRWLKR